jgi:hypothetical protein
VVILRGKAPVVVIFRGVVNEVKKGGNVGKDVNPVRADKSKDRIPVEPTTFRVVN